MIIILLLVNHAERVNAILWLVRMSVELVEKMG